MPVIVKQFASVTLMCILLYNLVGYRFVVDYMEQKYDAQLEARLDGNEYDESQLIELKIPLNLPYQTSWPAYERCSGEIEMDGITYKYVKRRLSNDTLYLKCIANTEKMHLQTVEDNFIKNNNDFDQDSPSKKPGNSKSVTIKKLLNEYDEYSFLFSSNLPSYSVHSFGLKRVERIITSAHVFPGQPPDFFDFMILHHFKV